MSGIASDRAAGSRIETDVQLPDVWGDCHPACTIGPNADHHGSSEYRCIDANGMSLPFPDEAFGVARLGTYSMYIFESGSDDDLNLA